MGKRRDKGGQRHEERYADRRNVGAERQGYKIWGTQKNADEERHGEIGR